MVQFELLSLLVVFVRKKITPELQNRTSEFQVGSFMAPDPEDEIKDEKNPRPLDEDDIALLKTYV